MINIFRYLILRAMFLLACLLLCIGCSNSESEKPSLPTHQTAEYIYRKHNDSNYHLLPPEKKTSKTYPWDSEHTSKHIAITKEFFRCKGCSLNPRRTVIEQNETKHYHDCDGAEKHSLPMRDGKEFIYPILIDLLNYLQNNLQKRVVITSGHRCPEHNSYVDSSPHNRFSKHMLGAEVTFYVQGFEEKPEIVIQHIQDYYKINAAYQGLQEYEKFQRYEKDDTNVSTPPWYNKEIFIKLFNKKEGRDFDNRHPYPYISVQVRYDRETNERVVYTWDKAHRGYHRR